MDKLMQTVYLSTAYFAPIQYYCKLISFDTVLIEAQENYVKQTYRNRCNIATTSGIQSLSIPIEKPLTEKCLTKDIQISNHGNWRHLHWNALVSAYGMSPYFEYYQDDLAPFYEQKVKFLFDFNENLRILICDFLNIQPNVKFTKSFETIVSNDFREIIRPKHPVSDPLFNPASYYQVFQNKIGFHPNLSIIDLVFNMGPESIFILLKSNLLNP